jgi:hypothetical protein
MKKITTLTILIISVFSITSSIAQTLQVKNNRCFADINGDGMADYIVLTCDKKESSINVYFSNGRGFDKKASLISNGIPNGIANMGSYFADVNGDGMADFITFQGNAQTPNIVAYLAMSKGYKKEVCIKSAPIDRGFDGFPRGFADVNGDGKADYLTFRGDINQPYVLAYFSTGNGFSQISYKSSSLLEKAIPNFTRAFADVNGDGMADYIDSRDGENLNMYLSNKIEYNYKFIFPYQTHMSDPINKGYDNMPRGFVDIDGDKRADYVTFRGDPQSPKIYTYLSYGSYFEASPRISIPIEKGYDNYPRGFADVNGDGKSDYIVFRGNPQDPTPVVYFSNGKDFDAPCTDMTITFMCDASYTTYFTLRYTIDDEEKTFQSTAMTTNQQIQFIVPAEALNVVVEGICNECYQDNPIIFSEIIDKSNCPTEMCYKVSGSSFKKFWNHKGCQQ